MKSRWVALSTLVLAVLLIAVDATVLSLAVPFLARDLNPSAVELLWIGDAYSFVLAGLLVTMGTLGDRIGRKRLLLIGATAFGLLSVLAAFAPSAGVLILARGLLGVAGATLMPSTLSIIRNLFTDAKERSLAIGVWGAMASAGAAVGPLVGGFLLEHFWWGSVFLINVPVMLVLITVGAFVLPESCNPEPGPWDLVGAVLSLVGVVGVVYAIKEFAANGFEPSTLVGAAVGVLALALFVRRQLRLPVPLVDVRLFAQRRFTGAVLSTLLAMFGLAGVAFFFSQFLQLVQGYGPMEAGLLELPATVGAVVAGLVAGALARAWSAARVTAAGLGAMGAALVGTFWLGPQTPYPVIGLALLVIGSGAGVAFTITADLVLSSVAPERAGAASAVSEISYELGTALGIAVLGSVLTAVYRADLRLPAGLPAPAVEAVRDSLASASGLPAEVRAQVVDTARESFVAGLQLAGLAAAVLLVLAAIAARTLLRDRAATH
ncbi:MFS transporter [Kutzneria viridogrisea]|uniref:DHA2 family multidrug resistance protein-like MFS transporter n=1 Tax=Kutzneria viridogrisea TaxID=47990 RepID=A0ABR6BQA7_9PSEU|nr:DHA2 family multidrug resistance protein-like MFS transporter [Kutzneria viridogrisea]